MRVAVLDDYQQIASSYADWGDLEPVSFAEYIADPERLIAAIQDFEVVVAMRERTAFPDAVLARLPALQLLVTTGPRNAAIDVAAAHRHGIHVAGTGGTATPTAELTWGLILSLLRHIPAEDAQMRNGGWQHTIGAGLAGRTLGIIGLGHLGRQVAAIGQAFRMEVLAWSQNLTAERAVAAGAHLVPKAELLSSSDVVSIHLVLSDRTRGLIQDSDLAAMKPTAILVNTSRGPIVDEMALVKALHEGWIGGAGLDVYDVEPLPHDHPLRTAPRTVLTPHLGYVTDETYRVFYRDAVEDIAAWRRGEPIRLITG